MTLVASVLSIFVVAQNVYAQCTLNGEIVPCEDVPKWPFAIMGLFFIGMMLLLVFWVWMLVDVVQNEKDNDLVVWMLILVFTGFIGAIIYYFVRKRNRIKTQADVLAETQQTQQTQSENIEQ